MANSGVCTLTVDWPETPKSPERFPVEALEAPDWALRLEEVLLLKSLADFSLSKIVCLSPGGSGQGSVDSGGDPR